MVNHLSQPENIQLSKILPSPRPISSEIDSILLAPDEINFNAATNDYSISAMVLESYRCQIQISISDSSDPTLL